MRENSIWTVDGGCCGSSLVNWQVDLISSLREHYFFFKILLFGINKIYIFFINNQYFSWNCNKNLSDKESSNFERKSSCFVTFHFNRLQFLQSPPRWSEERGGGTAGGRTKAARRWFVRVSKWHVNVDCGQYRRRTSEGRPTFFPSEHTDKSISTRAVVSRFPAAPASTAGSLTHRPIVHDETGPRSPPFAHFPRYFAPIRLIFHLI